MGTGRQLHVGSMVTSSNSELKRGEKKETEGYKNPKRFWMYPEKLFDSFGKIVYESSKIRTQCATDCGFYSYILLDGIKNSPHVLVHFQTFQ